MNLYMNIFYTIQHGSLAASSDSWLYNKEEFSPKAKKTEACLGRRKTTLPFAYVCALGVKIAMPC
jgi:hypothetical protein